jgi:hypothetical protein
LLLVVATTLEIGGRRPEDWIGLPGLVPEGGELELDDLVTESERPIGDPSTSLNAHVLCTECVAK